jgi:protein phosphatase
MNDPEQLAALRQARAPQTPPARLQELASGHDPAIMEAVAASPNAPLDLLIQLMHSCPGAVLENPALMLLELEAPGALNSLPEATLIKMLQQPAVPEWLARQLLACKDLRTEHQMMLAAAATTPAGTLLALAASDHLTVRCEVARNPSLPEAAVALLASDPSPHVRASLAVGTPHLAWITRLSLDEHPTPRLFARSRLEPRPQLPVLDLQGHGETRTGQRAHNEDDLAIAPLPGGYLAVVSDGMGGHSSGYIAAEAAVREMPEIVGRLLPFAAAEEQSACLQSAIQGAHLAVCRLGEIQRNKGVGATVVALLICGDQAHIGHVGDSRAYRLRQGKLAPLTRDHSLINDYLSAFPDLPAEKIAELPRNVITRALGVSPDLNPDQSVVDIEPDDLFLLCSDGLTAVFSDEQLAGLLAQHRGNPAAASTLAAAAEKAGSTDNITVIIVDLKERWGYR